MSLKQSRRGYAVVDFTYSYHAESKMGESELIERVQKQIVKLLLPNEPSDNLVLKVSEVNLLTR